MKRPERVVRATDLVLSGRCSAQCLLAFGVEVNGCRCRCGGVFHGALAEAQVAAAGGATLIPAVVSPPGPERRRIDEAVEWLRSYIDDPGRGPVVDAQDVLSAAAAAGINERTLQRARRRVGLSTRKQRHGWVWLAPVSLGRSS